MSITLYDALKVAFEGIVLEGSNVGVDTTGFNGNLGANDDTLQKIATVLDSLSTGGSGTASSVTVSNNLDMIGNDLVNYPNGVLIDTNTSGIFINTQPNFSTFDVGYEFYVYNRNVNNISLVFTQLDGTTLLELVSQRELVWLKCVEKDGSSARFAHVIY